MPGPGDTCFAAGTQVRLANGKDKNIEDVEIGEVLLGMDGEHNSVVEFDHPKLGDRQLYAINNDVFFITWDHALMTEDGWKAINPVEAAKEHPGLDIGTLEVGDKILQVDNPPQAVVFIDSIDADPETQLYNFKLHEGSNHTYYANGHLAHNKAGDDLSNFGGPRRSSGLNEAQVQAMIDEAAAGGTLFSSDPFVRAGQISAEAIEEGTAANLEAIEAAIGQLQEQFQVTQDTLAPFQTAGLESLDEIRNFQFTRDDAASFDERIAQITGGDTFRALIDERLAGAQSALGAAGLRRSGTALADSANIGTDLALQLEGQLFGRQQAAEQAEFNRLAGLTQQGFGAAQGIAGFNTNLAQQIAALTGQGGAIRQSGITGAADAVAEAMLASAQQQNNRRGGSSSSSLFGTIVGGALGGLFSDPLLKKNMTPIGKIGNLILFEWEWIDNVKGTIVEHMPTIGFLSTQVREHYPEYVSKFAGWDVIDYAGLHEELEAA